MTDQPHAQLCAKCSSTLPGDAGFCPRCGTARRSGSSSSRDTTTNPNLADRSPTNPDPAAGSSSRRSSRFLILAAVTALVVAGGSLWAFGVLGGGGHTIRGQLALVNGGGSGFTNTGSEIPGSPCAGYQGFEDISAGAQVRVEDGSGKQIGIGQLSSGVVDVTNFSPQACVFTFTVADVPEAAIYQFSAGNSDRGGASYTKNDLAKASWKVQLTLEG